MGYFRWEIFSEKGVMENVSWTNLEKTNGCRIGLEEEDKEKEKKKEESGGEKNKGEEGVKPKVRSVPDRSDNQRIIQSHSRTFVYEYDQNSCQT